MAKRLVHPVTGSYLIRMQVRGKWHWQAFTADGKFADKATKDMLTKYWFGRKRMWRLTVGHDWVIHGEYTCTKIQAWGPTKIGLRAKMETGRWVNKVLEHSAETILEDHVGYEKYVKKEGDWKPNVAEWFDWMVDIGWDRVPIDRALLGTMEGPRSEKL